MERDEPAYEAPAVEELDTSQGPQETTPGINGSIE
jgi:hypothetical protein